MGSATMIWARLNAHSILVPSLSAPAALIIPDEELGRQAVCALRGYAYQVWASALAWSRLQPGEVMLLEVADDYSVLSADALDLKQVKDTVGSGSVTLMTQGVQDAINRLWRFRKVNSGLRVTLAYLTTSTLGSERDLRFPGNVPGLIYWRTAARDGSDTQPIRAALAELSLDADLRTWITGADDQTLREGLLRPMTFVCAEPALLEIESLLDESLAHLCATAGARGTDVRRLRDGLVVDVLRAAILADADARRLRREDLLKRIADTGLTDFPLMGAGATGPLVLDALATTRLGPTAKRTEAHQALTDSLANGRAWLFGPSGIGKTDLSRGIAEGANRPWFSVDLRDLNTQETARRLRQARQDLLTVEAFGGVVLDDLNASVSGSVKHELALLLRQIDREDARALITAYNPPPASVTSELGFSEAAIMAAPRFSDAETASLVEMAGGDPERWAAAINLFSGSGYPQLVAARIASIRLAGWPDKELSRMLFGQADHGLEDERESARRRLLEDLPSAAASLLYRLSLLTGPFDRPLALDLASCAPPIAEAGAALDLLRGPWLEPLANGRMRISPLLSDAGFKVLSSAEQDIIHVAISQALASRRPIKASDLAQLSLSAVRTEHSLGIGVLIQAALLKGMPDAVVARALYPLAFLRTDQPLFPKDDGVNRLLRLAQLKVAVTQGMPTVATAVYRRLAVEAETDAVGAVSRSMGTFMLVSADFDLPTSNWFPIIQQLAPDALDQASALIALHPEGQASDDAAPAFPIQDVGAFLFTLRSHKLLGLEDLADLLDQLGNVEAVQRERYFSGVGLERISDNRQTLVQAAWMAEAQRENFDPEAAIDRLRMLETKVNSWPDPALTVELISARLVMLSEYADRSPQALDEVDVALREQPGSARLRRERVKILIRLKRFAEVAADAERLLEDAACGDAVERAFAARDVAIATAERGDLAEAIVRFQAAGQAAMDTVTLRPFGLRLAADAVILRWRSGDRDGALAAARDLFIRVEADAVVLEGDAGADLVRGLYLVSEVMNQDLASPGWDASFSIIGAASRPGDQRSDLPQPEILAAWYRLAEVEYRLGIDCGIEAGLQDRVQGGRLVAFEATRVGRIDTSDVASPDPLPAATAIVSSARAMAWLQRQRRGGEQSAAEIAAGMFVRVQTLPWQGALNKDDDLDLLLARQLAMISLAFALARNDPDWLEKLKAATQDAVLAEIVADLQSPTPTLAGLAADLHPLWALRQIARADHDVPDLFIATALLHQWLGELLYAEDVAREIGPLIASRWRTVATERRFALGSPSLSAPSILAVADRVDSRAAIARLLLASRSAVRVSYDPQLVLDWKASAGLPDADRAAAG